MKTYLSKEMSMIYMAVEQGESRGTIMMPPRLECNEAYVLVLWEDLSMSVEPVSTLSGIDPETLKEEGEGAILKLVMSEDEDDETTH